MNASSKEYEIIHTHHHMHITEL